jgi:hypothetical protein
MAAIAYPSWAYNLTAPAQIVQTAAAFTALGPGWTQVPFAPVGQIAPFDAGFPTTDIRLQQILDEMKIANQYLYAANGSQGDDPQALRADVVVTDVALTS